MRAASSKRSRDSALRTPTPATTPPAARIRRCSSRSAARNTTLVRLPRRRRLGRHPVVIGSRMLAAALIVAALVGPVEAFDHLDGPAVTTDPSTDITDLFAW